MTQDFSNTSAKTSGPPEQPILGFGFEAAGGFGFSGRIPEKRSGEAIPDTGNGHLMTIAPTGAGKGRSAIIPTLLSYQGPVIVVDPKGENYQVTARRRCEIGQDVYVLDPFGTVGDPSDSFNPLDTFDPGAPDAYDHAAALAELIAPGRSLTDPFWSDSGRSLVALLLLHVASARPPVLRNVAEVAYLLNQSLSDMHFTFKEMERSKLPLVRQLAAGWSATDPKVLASILSTAKTAISVFNSDSLARMSGNTNLPLDGIERGDPISLYLVLPPDKLDTHGKSLRLWIGCLMDIICRRRHQVEQPTLFILDEAAQLGTLKQLRRAITLLRGYGVRTWSFWQDLSQLQTLYPDWETLYNNTRYIQTFGATTHLLASKLAYLLNLPGDVDPLSLGRDKLILAEAGSPARVAVKPDYLNDECFQGLYDDNAFYQPAPMQEQEGRSRPVQPWQRRLRVKHQATALREAELDENDGRDGALGSG